MTGPPGQRGFHPEIMSSPTCAATRNPTSSAAAPSRKTSHATDANTTASIALHGSAWEYVLEGHQS